MKTFKLRIITLKGIEEKEIRYLKLRDESGFFGIMAGHTDFLTIVEPGVGEYIASDHQKRYIATDSGFLLIFSGMVTLSVYEIFEGSSPEELADLIAEQISKRKSAEARYRKLITEIEETFLKRALEIYRV